jgi:sulfur-carrier protein adenylyltransferase/sulfurtransferase
MRTPHRFLWIFWTLFHASCLEGARVAPASFAAAPIARRRTASTLVRSSALSHDEIRRYSRHLVLSDVGLAGQIALKQAAVLVIGAGGLGSPVLLYLAAAGVGHVGIVDADTVDESNLQRQVVHRMTTVGESKCISAQQAMHEINPQVRVRCYPEEFTASSARRIVGDGFAPEKPWDIVIDGSDNFPTKYLIKYVLGMIVFWVLF